MIRDMWCPSTTGALLSEVERLFMAAESKLGNIPDTEIRRLFIKQLVARRDERQFLTINELSEELGIDVRAIREWRNMGTGPKVHKIGRYLRYRRTEIEEWLTECQRKGRKPRDRQQ